MPWLKAQFFGRSTQQDGAESIPDQRLLLNEPEVLAAIEAADAAHAVQTTKVESHQRQHTGGREAIPEHFRRIRINTICWRNRRSARSVRHLRLQC